MMEKLPEYPLAVIIPPLTEAGVVEVAVIVRNAVCTPERAAGRVPVILS
jgi:hypothetical protein